MYVPVFQAKETFLYRVQTMERELDFGFQKEKKTSHNKALNRAKRTLLYAQNGENEKREKEEEEEDDQ